MNIFQDLVDLRRHQRPPAEMAMHRDVEIGHRLVGVEIVERVLVHIVPVPRVAAQHAMIGEIRMRQRHQLAMLGVDAERQIDVVVVAVPQQAGLRDELFGVGGRGQHWAQPAFRRRARQLLEYADALGDDRALFVGRQVRHQCVLRVRVGGDFVARFQHLLDCLGGDLHRMGIGNECRRHVVFIEDLQQTPDAACAAIGAPRHGGAVVCARLERRGLHRERRSFVARPVFHQARHHDGHAGAVGPGKSFGGVVFRCHGHAFSQGQNRGSRNAQPSTLCVASGGLVSIAVRIALAYGVRKKIVRSYNKRPGEAHEPS